MKKLEELRKQIDEVDKDLARLLIKRMNLSEQIGNLKKVENIPVFDPQREEQLKEALLSSIDPKFRNQYSEILETILKVSKDIQL